MLLLRAFFCEAAQAGTTDLDIENQKFVYDNITKSWKNSSNVLINASNLVMCRK